MRLLAATAVALATVLTAPLSIAKGLEPTQISLPKGPGSIEGLGRNFAPSLASGTASYGVDIAVPPSAGGFAPHLSLDYDSGGGVTELGMGWRLGGLPQVRRRTENGLPKFDASDAFEITGLGIACDLLETTPGTFRPEYESGAFMRVQKTSDGWEARDKSGTTYRFGGAGFTESEGASVATWLLREQLDLHGHRIAYAWDTSSGHALLTSVTWNDYGADVRNVVAITYQDRPDPHALFSAGIKQLIAKRATKIDVTHGGALVRRYELAYAPGVHSRLASVDLVGRDGTSRLPRLSLGYTEPSFAAAGQIVAMQTPPGRSPSDPNVEITDLDGDGLPDLLVTIAGQFRSYVNHDGVSWKPGVDWDASQSPSVQLGSTGVQLADLDGDGAIDLVVKSGTADFRYLPGNDATSFRPPVSIATVPNVTFEDPDVKLADMDGDRRIDVVVTTAAGLAIGYNINGVDWTTPAIVGNVDANQPLRFSDGGHTQLCDVNGDRVQDLCYLRSQSLVYWLGRGRGKFERAQTATGVPSFDPSSPWELHDLDGDGWVDLVHVGVDQVDYALAIGAGKFDAPKSIAQTPYKGPSTVVRFADMNGSGTTDIVWIDVSGDPSQAWRYLELFPKGRGGLLSRVDNGLGKITSIAYGPAARDAAAARDASKPWTSRMNVAMSVVKRVETDVSLGDPLMATEYTYRDGTWSPKERTFAGFAGGVDRLVGDEFTPTLLEESTFDVGLDDRTQRGLVVTSESRDEKGVVFTRSKSTYASKPLEAGPGGRFVHYTYKASEETGHVEGSATPRTTLVEWEQDDLGNTIAERHWGEVVANDKLAGNDEGITVRTFANNTTDWILGRVASEELQDASGKRVRMKRFYYDGAAFVGLPLGQIARGDASRSEEWVGPSLDQWELDGSSAFDRDGHVIETKDARGGGRLFQWDPHDHTTLLTESVKLDAGSLTERVEFDKAFGMVLNVTSYNGQTTSVSYDAFGRVTSIVKPGDSVDRPTARYGYGASSPLSRITIEQRVWNGRDDVERSEGLIDGAGRKRGTLTVDDGGRLVLGDVGLIDARGKYRRMLRPRFVGAHEHDAPPLRVDGVGTDTWRDAQGRNVRARTQMGIEARSAFEPFVTKRWDGGQTANGAPYEHTPTIDSTDGLGRVVATTHTLDGKPLTARSSYDAAGSLLTKIDPENNTSRYAYDGRGRRVLVDDPDHGKHSFAYDATGNLIEHRNPDGVAARFTHDLAGRDLTADWDGDGTPEVTHVWDKSDRFPDSPLYRGLLVKMSDPSGSTENEFDERGRVTKVHFAIGGSTYDVASAYDAQDREYWHQYPDKSSIRTYRSARGFVSALGQAITFDHDADGTELRRAFNTGVALESGYDEDRRVREHRVRAVNGSIVHHLKWAYDAASNIVGVEDARVGVDPAHDRSEQYLYDNLYRLTSAKGTWGNATWVYSPSGNMISRTSSVPELNAGVGVFGKGAGPHAMTQSRDRVIRYDARGRALDDGDRSYSWDAVDQLVKVTAKSGASVESTFGGTGVRRIRVERGANGEVHTTHFIDDFCESKDGKLARFIVHGGRRIAKLADGNGAPSGATAMMDMGDGAEPPEGRARIARLTGGLPTTLICIAGLLALLVRYRRRILRGVQLAAPAFAFALVAFGCSSGDSGPPPILEGTIHTLSDADDLLFGDALGSLNEQTTGNGNPKASFASYAFGVTRYDTSGETRKYADTPRDTGVGLDQMGARSYAPDLGVWTSPDPLGLSNPAALVGRSFASNNPYAYAGNNPITRTDRDGHTDDVLRALANPAVVPAVAALVTTAEVPVVGIVIVAFVGGAAVEYKLSQSGVETDPIARRGESISKAINETQEYYRNQGAPAHLNEKQGATSSPEITAAPKKPVVEAPAPKDNTEPRPKFRKETDRNAWNAAKDGSKPGTKQCPTCSKELTGKKDPETGRRDYDLDHTGKTWADRKKDLKGASRAEVIDEYQREVRTQCPHCNRGHKFEPGKEPAQGAQGESK
jgi:RHS repeat-associated protein